MEESKENVVNDAGKPVEPGPAAQAKSRVDALFDTLTQQTARGLVIAQGALETVARWLDGRAKFVGDLATKLSSSSPERRPGGPAESTAQ